MEMGWINEVVPKDKLDNEINKLCKRLLQMSTQSLRISEFQLNFASDMALPQVTHWLELARYFMKAPEMVEGTRAFLEKRKSYFYKVKI